VAAGHDVDPGQIDRMAQVMEGFQSGPAKRTLRYEDVIGDKHVDAVIIAPRRLQRVPRSEEQENRVGQAECLTNALLALRQPGA